MALTANHVALLTALIGIFTATFTFIIPKVYDDIIKNPKLDISIEPLDNGASQNITIRNSGNEPAYNVLMYLNAHNIISNITLISNNENITITNATYHQVQLTTNDPEILNSSFLRMDINRILVGDGDHTKFKLAFNERFENYPHFEISYAYNNESYSVDIGERDPVMQSIFRFFQYFTQYPYLGIIIPLALFVIYASTYIPVIKAAISREFFRKIQKDAIDVAAKLGSNNLDKKIEVRELGVT